MPADKVCTSCGIPRRSKMVVNGNPKYSFAETSCILRIPLNIASMIFIFYASCSPTPTFQSLFSKCPFLIHRSSRWTWHFGYGIGYLGRHKAFSQQFAFLHAFKVLAVLSLAFRHNFFFPLEELCDIARTHLPFFRSSSY